MSKSTATEKPVGIVVFPGTNCEHDLLHLYRTILKRPTRVFFHTESDAEELNTEKLAALIVPGGFSYGDYLRTGALAKLSPIMGLIKQFAEDGGAVLGICNGFQILCEAGLLPGVLLQNKSQKFQAKYVSLSVENRKTPWTASYKADDVITCPVAHGEGNFFIDEVSAKELEKNKQVVFRYITESGASTPLANPVNPNGAMNNIAGICNKAGNVVGLMPHPERAIETLTGYLGGDSGLKMFA